MAVGVFGIKRHIQQYKCISLIPFVMGSIIFKEIVENNSKSLVNCIT
jgi:hypothetical protein